MISCTFNLFTEIRKKKLCNIIKCQGLYCYRICRGPQWDHHKLQGHQSFLGELNSVNDQLLYKFLKMF